MLRVDPPANVDLRHPARELLAIVGGELELREYGVERQQIENLGRLRAAAHEAQNAQQVENLLESTALPAGSSRVKKETDFNIAVQAYVGMFYRGGESGLGFTNRYGLAAPIGVTFSHGFGKYGSVSAFVGAFDLGNIIQYKLNNQGAYEQNISFAGIFSPGLHLAYGFPGYWPLTLGVGCQWVSPVTSTSNNVNLSPHFNAFLGVDIPLFNLSATKKK